MILRNLIVLSLVVAFHQGHATDFPLKKRSSFAASPEAHNPFWPIGWTKAQVAEVKTSAAVTADQFVVTSILLNHPALAVVNGKEMAEGEVVSMLVANQQVLVQLTAVQDGRVILRCRDQELVIPLLRKGEGKPAAELKAVRS